MVSRAWLHIKLSTAEFQNVHSQGREEFPDEAQLLYNITHNFSWARKKKQLLKLFCALSMHMIRLVASTGLIPQYNCKAASLGAPAALGSMSVLSV